MYIHVLKKSNVLMNMYMQVEFYIARRSYDDLVYAVEINITQKANEMRFQVSEINSYNMFTLMWARESCTTS